MLLSRQELEAKEKISLAPYAVLSQNSQGRKYQENEDDNRTCFQKDRDRIIHSRAFRRLKGKTQVFVSGEGDHYRTRLTHSMEVAQVARDICRSLGLNEDLAEAIALAHDLGHTPFGHAGEGALNEMMQAHGFRFEHNNQSKRIVEKLEKVYPEYNGLNLSHETLEGLMKHQTAFDNPRKDMGVHPSLEAQVVDIADEIAYNSHDIDDGLRSGLISFEDLKELPLWKDAISEVQSEYGDLKKDKIYNARAVSKVMELMIYDLLHNTESNLQDKKIKSLQDVYNCQEKLVGFSSEMQSKLTHLKEFLLSKLYYHPQVVGLCSEGEEIIKKLFAYYENDVSLIPSAFISVSKSNCIAIQDYIAGMTDDFARSLVKNIK